MQASIFLARLMGPVLLVAGLALLINRNNFRALAEDVLASRALLFISGLMIMPAGLAIVLNHNVWTADWRGLITLLGWIAMIGGALRLLTPDLTIRSGRRMLRQPLMPLIGAGIWIVLGLILCFFGYVR